MTATDQASTERTPPNMSPVTVSNFVETHRRTLPSRIDRSLMKSIAGGDQPRILAALRFLGLTEGERDTPTALFEALRDARDDEAAVKAAWAATLRAAYEPIFTGLDLTTATQGAIDERFRDTYKIQGDTVRKAVAFFLALARNAGIPLSSYVKQTRQRGPGGAAKVRTPRTPRGPRDGKTAPATITPPAPAETPVGTSAMVVRFKSGGTATLYVNCDWVTISTEDRKALLAWIDAMKRYVAKNPVALPPPLPRAEPVEPTEEAQAAT